MNNKIENLSHPIKVNKNPTETSVLMNMNDNNPAEPVIRLSTQVKNRTETMISSIKTLSIPTASESAKSAKKRKITDYYKSTDTMETVVARMVALDGVSIRLFTDCQDMRRLFKFSGYNLPKSNDAILKLIIKKVDDAKEEMKVSIADLKKAGYKFTLSLEQWTSKQDKRYVNVSLHCKAMNTTKILGPVNITESTSSVAAFTSVNDYLKTFNVSMQEDIVSLTTDGSSDMRKIGIHFPGNHQWCLAQGVQSAVISTMYKTTPERKSVQEKNTEEVELSTDTSSESDDDSFVNSSEFRVGKPHVQAELHLHKQVIEKVRQVVKMIIKSDLKAAALQAYINKDFKNDTRLQIDDQKSWTSMVDMIGSFLKLKNCVLLLLYDIGSGIVFTEEELSCLNEVYLSLDLMRLVVLMLCRDDATLFTADTAMRCILIQLEEMNTDLSSKLAANLRKRIKDRRLMIAGVLNYLYDLKSFKAFKDDDTTFLKPTSEQITDCIVELLKQLKFKYVTEDGKKNVVPSSSEISQNAAAVLIFDHDMEFKVMDKGDQVVENTNFDLEGLVSNERKIYEKNGVRGVCLTKAYEYLLTVMPTNARPNKIFAVCGCVSTRIMSSHPDKMLETLIFLRTYFEEQRRI